MADTPMTDAQQPDPLGSLSAERRALLTMELLRRRVTTGQLMRQERGTTEPEFPLSPAQERLWFLDQADPGSAAYVMPAALLLRGPLHQAALQRSLDEVVRRHEVLRTTFPAEGGRPVQRVNLPRPVALPLTDLTDLTAVPAAGQQAAIAQRQAAEAGRPFDLVADLPIRAELLRLAAKEHVLLLSLHHIAADGWSLGVLVRELSALYTAFRVEAPSPLPELEVQYADYAVWQRNWLTGPEPAAQLEYWREHLAGAPVLELPADRPRPALRTWRGSSVPLIVPPELRASLSALANSADATLYMVLVAAFALVLGRWSGQPEVVVGSPVAGRSRAEIEPLVGFFVNTLPLRVSIAGEPSFRELLTRVREVCTAAYIRQDIPFGTLVQALRPDRAAGPVPLVQAMLALRDVPMGELTLPGLQIEELAAVSQSSKFDLSLELVPAADGTLHGRVEFSTDLLCAATARRIADAFRLVLGEAVRQPGRPVGRFALQSAAERDRILGPLAGSGSPDAAETAGCLHALIVRQALRGPTRTAVSCDDVVLSYAELIAQASQLAHRLRELGASPERLVGVCLPRSADVVVTLLGILMAGAGYVPLDPGYPRQRIELIVRDSQVPVVVTTSAVADSGLLAPSSDGAGPLLVLMDGDARLLASLPQDPPPDLAVPRSLGYVIYTSGSTGIPKGSANEHGGVVNTLDGLNRTLGLTADDTMLAISSLNYDMSVYEIFGTLLAGGHVVMPGDTDITDPERLRELLVHSGVTAWSSAPALLEMLVGHVCERGGLAGSKLRLAMLGGDRMTPALAGRLSTLLPGLRLYNLAGMTEVSYCSTYHLVSEATAAQGNIPWGRPLPNQRLYVLDRHGEPVPVGIRGELYIGGAGVRRGYWRRPALTAERFPPDQHGPAPGERLYRTGDAARWRNDGELEFLGRLDQQVKLRGFRIELGEIEAALNTHPDVKEPVVQLRQGDGETRLVAYFTSHGLLPPSTSELRRHLLDLLPGHMVPAAFVPMDRLPLLPSGKLDRDALPAPATARPGLASAYLEPAGPLEQVLAGIWADVLQLDRIGASDDFFELGGHSLLVTQAVSRIRDLFQVEFPIRGFLAAGTLRSLAERIRAEATAASLDADNIAEVVLRVSAMGPQEVAEQLREHSG